MNPPNPTLFVLYSELVLSLYPILIKTVNTNIFTQILARFLVFPILALSFGSLKDFTDIWTNPEKAIIGLFYNIVNLIHIGASYISYKNLPVSSAVSLFYLYPIFNVIAGSIIFGDKLSILSFFLITIAFIGTYLIATSKEESTHKKKDTNHTRGIIMAIIAAITETLFFIFIKGTKEAKASPYYTVNNLYPAGLILLGIYGGFNKSIIDLSSTNWMKLIGFNGLLGFTGYLSRFYAIPKIPTIIFSLLSFFGVSFGYIWGLIFTDDKPSIKAIFGGGLIVIATAILRYFSST